MKTRQKEYEKKQTKDGPAPAGVLTLSIPELATLLYAFGKLPARPQQRRDRGDGDER